MAVAASARRKRPASPSTLAEEEEKHSADAKARGMARAAEPAVAAAAAPPAVATSARHPAPLARLPSSTAAMQMETQSIDPQGFATALHHSSPLTKRALDAAAAAVAAGGSSHTAAASSHAAKAVPAAAPSAAASAASAAAASANPPAASVSLAKVRLKAEPIARPQPSDEVVDLSGDSQDHGLGLGVGPTSASPALALDWRRPLPPPRWHRRSLRLQDHPGCPLLLLQWTRKSNWTAPSRNSATRRRASSSSRGPRRQPYSAPRTARRMRRSPIRPSLPLICPSLRSLLRRSEQDGRAATAASTTALSPRPGA
jgi:hypothetical protein